ncbi:MAG: hypothetical protein LRY69_05555 [Gammaproteobacteria bacterium]|nr:hypothetical protein [Gammaproteobacteria bacterium]
MPTELRPPILRAPIPKQRVAVGVPYRLDLTEYIENSLTEEENFGDDVAIALLYSMDVENGDNFPPDLDYTITGHIYGQLRLPALENSPYVINITVTNGGLESLKTQFELEVLPPIQPDDEWTVDESLEDEFAAEIKLSDEEQQSLYDDLEQAEAEKNHQFTEEKQDIWQAILQGQSIPELTALLDRPITHQEVYYLLSRVAYFVIWDANNANPAGPLSALALKNASEHFHVYDRGSCIVATPKHLFDHGRTLFDAVKNSASDRTRSVSAGLGCRIWWF